MDQAAPCSVEKPKGLPSDGVKYLGKVVSGLPSAPKVEVALADVVKTLVK